MITRAQPGAAELSAFRKRQDGARFSYREVGATRGSLPAGYDHDRNRFLLGRGEALFEQARAALARWEMFPRRWSRVSAAETVPREGDVVAIAFQVFGLWWWNASRVVYTLEQQEPTRRSGFAYGTLMEHVESGEERFSVEWLADDTVWYDLVAFSRPRHPLVRGTRPLARSLQRRFVRESQAALLATVAGT